MIKSSFFAATLVLSFAASLAAHPNSQPDFLRAYVHSLILASEANRPFDTLPHYETGSREQIAAFADSSKSARATLTRAIDEIAPFTASVNQKIAGSATLVKGALETRIKLCDGWLAAYEEMSKPDGDQEAVTKRIAALRGDITKAGEDIGESAIDAVWAIVKIDARGRPQQWAVTWGERRAAQKELRTAFGEDIGKGPKPGQNYVQTAAAAFCRFLGEPGFAFLPRVSSYKSQR
jgi:hypothetical protein